MSILAYAITIIASQFCLLIGSLLSALLALMFAWVPTGIRVVVAPFLGAIAGPFASFGLAYLVFAWLTDGSAWGLGAVCAAMIPLAIPIKNDLERHALMDMAARNGGEAVRAFARPDLITIRMAVAGEIAGTVAVFVVFFFAAK